MVINGELDATALDATAQDTSQYGTERYGTLFNLGLTLRHTLAVTALNATAHFSI